MKTKVKPLVKKMNTNTDMLKGLLDNQAVYFRSYPRVNHKQAANSFEYVFWNSENHRFLIADYASDTPNFYNVVSIGNGFIVVIDRSFHDSKRKRIYVDEIMYQKFMLRITEFKRSIISEKSNEYPEPAER